MSTQTSQASTLRISLPPYNEGSAPIASISQVAPPSRPSSSASSHVQNFSFQPSQERIHPYKAVSRSNSVSALNGMNDLHVNSRSGSPAVGGGYHPTHALPTSNTSFTTASSSTTLFAIAPASTQEHPPQAALYSIPPISIASSTNPITCIPPVSVPVHAAIPLPVTTVATTIPTISSSLPSSAYPSTSPPTHAFSDQKRPFAFRRSLTSPPAPKAHTQTSLLSGSQSPVKFNIDDSVPIYCETPITSDYLSAGENHSVKHSFNSTTSTNDRHRSNSLLLRNNQMQSFDSKKFFTPHRTKDNFPHKKLFISSKDPPSIVLDSDPYFPNSALHQFHVQQQAQVQEIFSMIPITPFYSSPGSMVIDSPATKHFSATTGCN